MKRLMMTAALALFAAPALADNGPETKWKWGCEWQKADNGNYWFRIDGGCPMHIALGYGSANEMRGKDIPPATDDDDDDDDNDDDGDDGEGPGDDEGPGTDPGDDDEGPGDDDDEGPGDGGGDDEGPGDDDDDDDDNDDEGPGDEGPSKRA